MRISELSARSGVPIATVKYYLREGLLEPGKSLNARSSLYNEDHLTRLRLIRGLVHSLGASIAQVREILSIIDDPGPSPVRAMMQATSALPTIGAKPESTAQPDFSRAQAVAKMLGFHCLPDAAPLFQLQAAIDLSESVGIPLDDEKLMVYGQAAHRIAEEDFSRIPEGDAQSTARFAVLGTALLEPVLLALRRLAHHDLALRIEESAGGQTPGAEDESRGGFTSLEIARRAD